MKLSGDDPRPWYSDRQRPDRVVVFRDGTEAARCQREGQPTSAHQYDNGRSTAHCAHLGSVSTFIYEFSNICNECEWTSR